MSNKNKRPADKEEGNRLSEPGPLDCDAETGVCLVPGSYGVLAAASTPQAAIVEIDYYTDPVCSWCWATEPTLKRLKEEYGDQVHITYKMGGLLESWHVFYDGLNDIGRADQVAPHWVDVSRRSGMPIDEKIWLEDPPDSTYPASIAVKAAQRQGEASGEGYLRRVREMGLSERKNIERREVLIQAAQDVGLDVARFVQDLDDSATERAFREEMADARAQGISGFPTLVFRNRHGEALVLGGYRSYHTYELVLNRLAAGQLARHQPTDIAAFVARYGHVASQEVATVFRLSRDEAEQSLAELEVAGRVRRVAVANGLFWEPVDSNFPKLVS